MSFFRSYFKRYPALHYPDYRLMWTGQLISSAGTQMQLVALNWHIYTLTHSPIALGLIGLMRVIPVIIFAFIAGPVADTHNRKKVMYITQSASALFALLLALMTITNTITPFAIYVITVFTAIASAFDAPTRQAFMPSLVKREHLTSAISLNIIVWQTATIIGPAIAGFIIAHLGVGNVYLFNAISFFAVVIALIFMKADGAIVGTASVVALKSIKEGLTFVKSKPIIWSMMLLDFFSTFFSSATALLPIFAEDILSVGPQGLGLLYAAPATGALIAGIIAAHGEHMRRQGKIMLISVFFYALGTILFGYSRTFWLSFFALTIVGAGDSISTIIRHTIRQVVTPDNMRGRIIAINMIFFQGGPQLGEFEAGVVAALIGAPLSVITGGVANIFVVLIMAATIPALRNYDIHEDKK